MTTGALEQLRSQAMHLTELERAALAHDLIQILDAPADQDVGEAWEAEISRLPQRHPGVEGPGYHH